MSRKSTATTPQRKPLTPKVRFETLKRDDWTCRYCGRKTPAVVLEIDHVIPVVEGGTNEIENLVTSCFDCNRGKGRSLLTSIPGEEDLGLKAILLLERERQLREYNEVKRVVRLREESDIEAIYDYWNLYVNAEKHVEPSESAIRYWLSCFAVEDIISVMAYAISRVGLKDAAAYMGGIMKRKMKGEE